MSDDRVIDLEAAACADRDAVLELVAANIALRARVADLENALRQVLELEDAG